MTIYDDLQQLTKDLMKEFKQGTAKLITITPGTGPADNPGTSTETTYTIEAVAKGVSKKYMDNSSVVASDLEVISSVLDGVTPSEKDFIELDGTRYKIIRDISVPAMGTKVAWKFIVRKGG